MIAELVNNIKARLGASHRNLELDDRDIVNLLQNETLKTASIYNPFFLEYLLDPETERVEGMGNVFNVPMEIAGFETMGVEKVFAAQNTASMYGFVPYGILGGDIGTIMGNYLNMKLANGITGLMLPPDTFQYVHPGMLRIFNTYTQNKYFVVLRTTHKKDFSTFPYGLRETIMKLALADVANDLLGIRTFFQNLGSTFAEINLNTDMLNNWADKRDDLIENMRKNQLKNAGVRKIYVA
jgi:hypothetical protein